MRQMIFHTRLGSIL